MLIPAAENITGTSNRKVDDFLDNLIAAVVVKT